MTANKKVTMSLEELRNLKGYELAEKMLPFEHDYKNGMSSEDEPEQEWACLISLVESEDTKLDDLPGYGFNYFHPEKMEEEEKAEIELHLKKAVEIAGKVGLSKEELIEKLKSL